MPAAPPQRSNKVVLYGPGVVQCRAKPKNHRKVTVAVIVNDRDRGVWKRARFEGDGG